MKTIVAIWNSSEKGKSSTVLELANRLIALPSCKIIFSSKPVTTLSIDFRLIIEVHTKIIALESQGDPRTRLQIRLDDVVKKYNPDLIFCTCRTRGETVTAVNRIASAYTYDKIWTSTYDTMHSHKLINAIKAEHLLDLIIKMQLI